MKKRLVKFLAANTEFLTNSVTDRKDHKSFECFTNFDIAIQIILPIKPMP